MSDVFAICAFLGDFGLELDKEVVLLLAGFTHALIGLVFDFFELLVDLGHVRLELLQLVLLFGDLLVFIRFGLLEVLNVHVELILQILLFHLQFGYLVIHLLNLREVHSFELLEVELADLFQLIEFGMLLLQLNAQSPHLLMEHFLFEPRILNCSIFLETDFLVVFVFHILQI